VQEGEKVSIGWLVEKNPLAKTGFQGKKEEQVEGERDGRPTQQKRIYWVIVLLRIGTGKGGGGIEFIGRREKMDGEGGQHFLSNKKKSRYS